MKNSFWPRLLFAALLFTQSAGAQLPSIGGNHQLTGGAEYFAGRVEGKPLIKVNLVGGVRLPGVYYIPEDTNLGELLAYAGGATDGAQLEEVQVRSLLGTQASFKSYDFLALTKEPVGYPLMRQGDIVQINVEKDQLARTALWVGIIGAIASLALGVMSYQRDR